MSDRWHWITLSTVFHETSSTQRQYYEKVQRNTMKERCLRLKLIFSIHQHCLKIGKLLNCPEFTFFVGVIKTVGIAIDIKCEVNCSFKIGIGFVIL